MKHLYLAAIAVPVLGLAVYGLIGPRRHPTGKLSFSRRSPEANAAAERRASADSLYAKRDFAAAEAAYRRIIADLKSSPNPEVQDEVGSVRIRLGYTAAKRKDFDEAREVFLEAEKKYKGTGAMSADFGGIPDQGAYQAAVCLIAEGKQAEAHQAFLRFISDHPLSPLVHAAYKRLVRMNGGEEDKQGQDLLQGAIAKQEKYVRFETSVCGPKTLSYLLKALGRPDPGYEELAKRCDTNDNGTSLEGMLKGLKSCGLGGYAAKVNRKDLASLPLPAVWLIQDHYVVLLAVEPTRALVFDPRRKGESHERLPAIGDPDFTAIVITLQKPRFEEER